MAGIFIAGAFFIYETNTKKIEIASSDINIFAIDMPTLISKKE